MEVLLDFKGEEERGPPICHNEASHLVEIGVQHPSVHAFDIHSSADIGFFPVLWIWWFWGYRVMGPKTYATTYASLGEKKLSWLDRMCLKLETYYDIVEPGLAPSVLIQVCLWSDLDMLSHCIAQ